MVLNRDGLVWAGRRIAEENSEYDGSPQLWQMPQGGIDTGEDPLPAAHRELYEETGMRSVTLLAEAPGWITYDLPRRPGRHRAQGQVSRPDPEMVRLPLRRRRQRNPDRSAARRPCRRVRRWAWKPMAELPELIVPFKRKVYEQVVAAFRHLA